MESKQPWLEVLSPQGQRREIPLTQDRMSIGREGYACDLPLGPDPDSFVSRPHCYLERKHSGWWLTENGKNPTLLRQNEELQEIRGQVLLSDGNTFCLLGLVDENGTRLYWSLTLHDPGQTHSDPSPLSAPLSLKWDRARGALWRLRGKHAEEIPLTRHEWKLIDYMLERNRCARNAPVLCTNEELLEAAYGEPFSSLAERLAQPEGSLRQIITGLRRKLEVHPGEPKFLVGHRGQGYILYTYPPSR